MWKRLRALLSDSAFYGASSLIERVVGFVLLPLYTRYLGTEDYGIIAMLAIVTTVFAPLARLGMTNAIFRRFNTVEDEDERTRVLSTGLVSVIVSSAALCALGFLGAEPLTKLLIGSAEAVFLVQLSLVTAALTTLGDVPMAALRAQRRVKTIAVLNLARLAVTVAVTIWLVVAQERGVLGFVVALLVAVVAFLLVSFWITRRAFRPVFDLAMWKGMASYGLPFVPHHVQAVGMVYFGQYVVREMLSLEQAGLYNVALRFALPLGFVVGALQKAWVPFKFEVHATDDRSEDFFSSAVTYYAAAVSYVLVGVAVWAPEFLRLMTAPEFHAAAVLVPMLALIPIAQGFYFMLGTGIELTDDTRLMPLVSFMGLVAVVVLSYLAVPRLGAGGAAMATALGWLVMAAAIYRFSQRVFAVRYDFRLLTLFVGVAVLIAFGVAEIQGQPVLHRVGYALAATVLFPGLIVLALLRSEAERDRMRMLWARLPFTSAKAAS